MGPSGMLDVKRIYLEIYAAHRSFPYDVRLGEYALLVKEGLPIRLLQSKAPRFASAYAT